MNAWLDRINGVQPQPAPQSGMQFQNPLQKMQYIYQAMTNPAAFVKQKFPDIPDQVLRGGPNQVGQYLQNKLGMPSPQAQQFAQQYQYPYGGRY